MVIVGFTAPRRSRKYFGSLVLAVRDGKDWRYVGRAGTGFNRETLHPCMRDGAADHHGEAGRREGPRRGEHHLDQAQARRRGEIHRMDPKGEMRHPVFLGLRTDKKATDVIREIPKPGARPAT